MLAEMSSTGNVNNNNNNNDNKNGGANADGQSPVLATTKTTTTTTTKKKVAELKPRKYKIATSEPNSRIPNKLRCVPLYRTPSLSLPLLPQFPDRPHESK